MRKNSKLMIASAVLAAAVSLASSAGASVVLTFDASATSSNNPATGASGKATLSFSDVTGGVGVSVFVENTTGDFLFGANATTSKLTGFAFDLNGLSYVANSFVGGTYLDTLIIDPKTTPFGSGNPATLDIAGANDGNFNGGGAPVGAMPEGQSDTFSLTLSGGTNAAAVEASFASFFLGSETSVLRFQSVNAGAGSDKLTNPTVLTRDDNQPDTVPLPAAGWMLIAGVIGLGAIGRRRKAA